MLALLTLLVLAIAAVAGKTSLFGRASPYVATVSYSATFLFHLIPGVTETTTRLPFAKPLFASAEADELKVITGILFVLFLVGATLQVLRLRARPVVSPDEEAALDGSS
jgi:membrane protein YdbS with pleckstrin-like domain